MQLDITKPLRRIVKVEGKNGKEITCFIKYERLSIYSTFVGEWVIAQENVFIILQS